MKITARKELALLHPDRSVVPGSTREWLSQSSPKPVGGGSSAIAAGAIVVPTDCRFHLPSVIVVIWPDGAETRGGSR